MQIQRQLAGFIKKVLLSEGRLEDAIARLPEREQDIRSMAEQDPSGNLKYLNWGIRQLKLDEPLEEIIEAIALFHRYSNRLKHKDIARYPALADLRADIEQIQPSKSELNKKIKSGAKKIYEDEKWLVVNPYTKEASQLYGKGSRWCIAATVSHNYFEHYASRNLWFYFIIDKRTEDVDHGSIDKPKTSTGTHLSKIALPMYPDGTVYTNDIRDALDRLLTIDQLEDHIGEKWGEIFAAVKQDLVGKGNTPEYARAVKDNQRREYLSMLKQTSNQETIAAAIALVENEDDTSVRSALIHNSNIPTSFLKKCLKNAIQNRNNDDIRVILQNGALPEDEIRKAYFIASAENDVTIVDSILRNPALPNDIRDDIIFNGRGLEGSYTVKQLVLSTLQKLNASDRLSFYERLLTTNANLSSSTFRELVKEAKTVEELRILLKSAGDNPTKKYFIKMHPAAIEYAAKKKANQ